MKRVNTIIYAFLLFMLGRDAYCGEMRDYSHLLLGVPALTFTLLFVITGIILAINKKACGIKYCYLCYFLAVSISISAYLPYAVTTSDGDVFEQNKAVHQFEMYESIAIYVCTVIFIITCGIILYRERCNRACGNMKQPIT